jgi:hypothetical protein
MSDLCRLVWCALIGLFRSRAALEAEIIVLRHQLNILRRSSPKRVTHERRGHTEATRMTHSVIGGQIFAVMHNAALGPANLTTGVSQGVCCRSSTKVMVSGWPAMVFPSASVNGKDAHRSSICATAMRYGERSVSDASLD